MSEKKGLATAYGMARRKKKYQDGGAVKTSEQASTTPVPAEKSTWQKAKDAIGSAFTPDSKELDDRKKRNEQQAFPVYYNQMAEGGEVKPKIEKKKHANIAKGSTFKSRPADEEPQSKKPHFLDGVVDAVSDMEKHSKAEGGEVEMDKKASVASALMAEEDEQMMAEGGQVDLSMNADEEPNNEDQMSFEALKKENYSESAGLDQMDSPMDSNLHGQERDDEHDQDLVRILRNSMRRKSPISE